MMGKALSKSNTKSFLWGFTHIFSGNLSELTQPKINLLKRDFKDIKKDFYSKNSSARLEINEKFKQEIARLSKKQ